MKLDTNAIQIPCLDTRPAHYSYTRYLWHAA